MRKSSNRLRGPALYSLFLCREYSAGSTSGMEQTRLLLYFITYAIEKVPTKIAFILWLIFSPSAPEKHIQNTAGSCWPCESNVILDKKLFAFALVML